ncbi:hypothetical protein HDV02_004732, partial [Globomyces sp. JEL0801]
MLRQVPLEDISDLIGAIKENYPNKLGKVDVDDISIRHSLEDKPLDSNILLSNVVDITFQNPLIITVKAIEQSGMKFDNLTPKVVLKSLINMISIEEPNCNVFSALESMENLNMTNSILNLNIKGLGGIPNLLYSEEIYSAETEIGIKMPIDKLLEIGHKTIVMIGVSGCGKTRSCYDICRHTWGLYFDCFADQDFKRMIEELVTIRPAIKSESSQQTFEVESKKRIQCLISARMLVLQTLLNKKGSLNSFKWLCIQRSRRSRNLFAKIYSQLSQLPFSVSEAIFDSLKSWFPKDGKIIFDEAQCCLEHLNLDYRSCSSNVQPKVVNGQFTDPRSFFSFLTRTVIESGLKSIWCGTHMRIRSMDLFSSAAGNKIDEVCLFTDFNYLKPSEIFQLLSKWLNVDEEENLVLFEEIASRTTKIHHLISAQIGILIRHQWLFPYDPSLGNSSPYYFWEQRISWTFGPIDKKDVSAFEVRQVSDTLIRLCLSFLFGDGSSMDVSPGTDLVSTGLVMITKSLHSWQARMAEPLVLTAGLNFLADQGPGLMLDYFANKLFAPVEPLNSTPQERGHMMELVIALRFVQGWWLEPGMKKYLPLWAQHLNIQKPLGVIDCRLKESGVDMFVQQLRNAEFPWMILPAVNAGPDLRYS